MAALKYRITSPRTVYTSPEGRIVVKFWQPNDYSLELDGRHIGSYQSADAAEHEGAMMIEEEARQLAADLADEAAEPYTYTVTETVYGGAPAYSVQTYRDGRPLERYLRRDPQQITDRLDREGYERCDPEETDGPQEEGGEGGPGPDDIRSVDLTELRRAVDGFLMTNARAAAVSAGVYLWDNGLLWLPMDRACDAALAELGVA